MKKAKYMRYVTAAVLLLILAIIIMPLLWSISMSFDRTATTHLPEFSLIPHEPSMFNYQAAAKMIDLPQYFKNTVVIVLVNTFLANYSAETLTLTVDGAVPESGHAVYDLPMSFFADNIPNE